MPQLTSTKLCTPIEYYSLKSTECGVWWNESDFIIRQPLHTLQIRPV